MRVFNKDKTKELFVYDLGKGYLVAEKLFVAHHPEVSPRQEIWHHEVKETFPNGGKTVERVVDYPAEEGKAAWDEYEDIQVYVPYSEEQLKNKRAEEIKKRLSQLSEDFIQSFAGAFIEDIEDRKKEFSQLHNELRLILGKTERIYY